MQPVLVLQQHKEIRKEVVWLKYRWLSERCVFCTTALHGQLNFSPWNEASHSIEFASKTTIISRTGPFLQGSQRPKRGEGKSIVGKLAVDFLFYFVLHREQNINMAIVQRAARQPLLY